MVAIQVGANLKSSLLARMNAVSPHPHNFMNPRSPLTHSLALSRCFSAHPPLAPRSSCAKRAANRGSTSAHIFQIPRQTSTFVRCPQTSFCGKEADIVRNLWSALRIAFVSLLHLCIAGYHIKTVHKVCRLPSFPCLGFASNQSPNSCSLGIRIVRTTLMLECVQRQTPQPKTRNLTRSWSVLFVPGGS